ARPGLLGGRVVAGVVHGDQGAVGAQPLGDGPADAPRGAGHQRRLTGQIPHVDLLVCSSGWFGGLVWLCRGLDRNLSSRAVPITRFRRSALAGIDDPAERVERNVGGGHSGPVPRGPQVTQTLEPGNDRLGWRPAGGQVVRRRRLSSRGAQERLDEAVVVVGIRGALGAAHREGQLGVGANLCRGGVDSSASSNEADVTAARSDVGPFGRTYGYFSASTCW